MNKSKLGIIENSVNPERSIHVLIFSLYKEFGYDKTHEWIKQMSLNVSSQVYPVLSKFLQKKIIINEQFEPFKVELTSLVLELKVDNLESWALKMKEMGYSHECISEVFTELFVYVQFNPKTENADSYYDLVADFSDKLADL